MGVRISIYAVKLEHLKTLATLSLRDLMQHYSEQSCVNQSRPPAMHFITEALGRVGYVRYQVRPGQAIWRQNKLLTAEEMEQDTFLSTSLREYFIQDSSIGLKNLFNCLSCCPDKTRIYRVSSGYRRWWMGSFLDYAEQFYGASSETYTRLVRIFQKILRGYDCGKIMQKAASMQPFEPDFPLIPGEDVDTRLAVLSHDDLRLLIQVVNEVPSSTVFHAPPEKVGIAPDNDEDWNEWVWQMIKALRIMDTLKNEVHCLITLIG